MVTTWNEAATEAIDQLLEWGDWEERSTEDAVDLLARTFDLATHDLHRKLFLIAWPEIPRVQAYELALVLAAKQADYGHNNILRYGKTGLSVRIHDKIARMENLIKKDNSPMNESLYDSFLDVCGYCVIWQMLDNGTFRLPLAEDSEPSTEYEDGSPILTDDDERWTYDCM